MLSKASLLSEAAFLSEAASLSEANSFSSGTSEKERHLWAKPSSLGKTFLGILDPEIPRFVDSAQL